MTTLRCVGLSLLVLLGLAVAGGCGAAGSAAPSYVAPPSYEALPSRPPVETGGGATDAYGQIRVDGSGFTHLLQLADAQTGEPIAGVRVLYAEQDGAGALLVQDATGTYPSTLTGLASEAPVQGTTYPSAVVAPAQIGPAQVGPAQVVPAEGVTAVLLPAVGRMHGRHGERASAPTTADLADALLREAVDEEVWVEVGVTRLDALRGALQGWFSSGGSSRATPTSCS